MRPEVYIVGRDAVPSHWSVPAGESLSVALVVLPGLPEVGLALTWPGFPAAGRRWRWALT